MRPLPSFFAILLLVYRIATSALPIIGVIALVPLIRDDLLLTGIYIVCIIVALALRQDKKDLVFLAVGFVGSTIGELLFIATGVEIFTREVLIWGMPVWLPFMWGYIFIMMRRAALALEKYMR
jgi:hypothetical protein